MPIKGTTVARKVLNTLKLHDGLSIEALVAKTLERYPGEVSRQGIRVVVPSLANGGWIRIDNDWKLWYVDQEPH